MAAGLAILVVFAPKAWTRAEPVDRQPDSQLPALLADLADAALVAALPRPVAERLLSGVLDLVYRPASG